MSLPFEGYVIFKDYVTHLEYIRSCEELWQKGLYVELHAYQHHVFMDWRFVDDESWREIHLALNGAGVQSMQAKWDGMFGVKEEEVVEEVKVKKPRKKAVVKTDMQKSRVLKIAETKAGSKKALRKKVTKKILQPLIKSSNKKTVKRENIKATSKKKTTKSK